MDLVLMCILLIVILVCLVSCMCRVVVVLFGY